VDKLNDWNAIPHRIGEGFQWHQHSEIGQDMTVPVRIEHIQFVSPEVIFVVREILEIVIRKVSTPFATFSKQTVLIVLFGSPDYCRHCLTPIKCYVKVNR